ncbi:MAG: DUF1612 and helix-turn-helix domain-containing protein, partial [Planctomycetales bacterium]|nr:DUF1612 and helix-turn-helix domain-containing protein [Planctomycetales bacterium]
WAVSRSGIMALAGVAEESPLESKPSDSGGEGAEFEQFEDETLSPELAGIDEVLEKTKWLVDENATAEQKRPEPGVSVGELLIRDPDWDEGERIGEWLDFAKQVERLPATLAAALLWDAWEHLEPLQRQHWLGQVLVSDFLRSRGKVRSHLLAYAVGLREIPRERRRARDRTTRLIASLDAMSAAAAAGMKDIDRLTLAKRQLERKALGKRSTSSLPVAIHLLLSRPIVSAHMIAKSAKISPRGALNLIGELGVREMTGRGRYRAWGVL